jgi:hypothetical protein
MLQKISRMQLIAAWIVTIVVLFALSVVRGANLSVGASAPWLLACIAPPAVMLLVWREPTQTVAELLHAVNQPTKDGRR